MKHGLIAGAALFVLLAAGIAGVRALARHGAAEVFPLPDANGCWLGICFADLSDTQIRAAIVNHPTVSQRSAYGAPDTYALLVEVGQAHPVAVTLYAPGEWYRLSWDWTLLDNPVIMCVGDLIAALGLPDRIRSSINGMTLYYAGRHLQVVVSPTHGGPDWALLQPDSPVRVLHVFPREVGEETLLWGQAWRAFGAYWFDS